jgi:DNA-directed RNA polymerase beta subunit
MENMENTNTNADKADKVDKVDNLQPQAKREPIEQVSNTGLTEEMMKAYIIAAVQTEGLVGHNISAFNDLTNVGIPYILQNLFRVDYTVKNIRDQTAEDRSLDSVRVQFSFGDVQVGPPVYATYPIGVFKPLYPNEARLSDRAYSSPLSMSAEVTLTAHYKDGREEVKHAELPPFQVAPIPIMVGSSCCHTWNLTRDAKKGLEEDPNESGGYFIAKGGEWVVDSLENIAFNDLHVYLKMLPNERVRGDYISQPGGAFENSSQLIIRYMTSGAITFEINSTKFGKSRIPFFLIFRIFGMTSDGDIVESIVYDPESKMPIVVRMMETINRAIQTEDPAYSAVHTELNREAITGHLAARLARFVTNPTAYRSDEHAVQFLNTNLLDILDRVLLPHMGRSADARTRKLRFLGMLVHKTLLVDLGVLEPTDRDSLQNKRIHGAGVSLAKALKTQFNTSIIMPIKNTLRREVRNMPFSALTSDIIADAIRNPIASADLARTMEQAITSGNSTIVVKRLAIRNRVSTQALERKNQANYICAMRTVSAHNASQASTQTKRADLMRRVHPTYVGYVCVAKSADTGENVGMKKELAITSTVCTAGESLPLKVHLRTDPDITPLDKVVNTDIARKHLASVFVDGEWVGCCTSAHSLIARYRALRREGRVVDPRASIVWNAVTDDVEFLLDVGRMVRPILIVDNNLEQYNSARRDAFVAKAAGSKDWESLCVSFVQNTRFTTSHFKDLCGGKITLENLIRDGVAEWITPNEATNCYLAKSIIELREARNDVTRRFTHVDVEQSIYGLTALLSPYANHTQPARVTYETNQARQACGWFAATAPFRGRDKNVFFQHYVEQPLVSTLAYSFLAPNGSNTVVAYMVKDGYNQEDSAIISESYVKRGGFHGSFYRYERADLEKGEAFGNPDITTTKNLKPNASYEKLVDGFVTPGTVVNKGDVIIGRFARIQAGGRRGVRNAEAREDGYQFVDRSVVYHLSEPATVVSVFTPRGPNDNVFGIVKLRFDMPLGVGEKLSSRAGNKSIVALLMPQADMPFTETGETPDLIINPHCLAGETAVTMPCGLSRRIDSLSLSGGELVWGWQPSGLRAVPHSGLLVKSKSEAVFAVSLTDGRELCATSQHPVLAVRSPTETPQWVRVCDLDSHYILAGLDGPVDTSAQSADFGWKFEFPDLNLETLCLVSPKERERSLAFARILGYFCGDSVGEVNNKIIYTYTALDLDSILDDISILTDEFVFGDDKKTHFETTIPSILFEALRSCSDSFADAMRGKFVMGAPVCIVREFLGGLFGSKACAPCISPSTTKNMRLVGTSINWPSYDCGVHAARTASLLASTGVVGCVLSGSSSSGWTVSCPSDSSFGAVGFRHSVVKMALLSAANSYWRTQFRSASHVSLRKYLTTANCYHWFFESELSVIETRYSRKVPTFLVRCTGVRPNGVAPVFDISVPGPTSFVAGGLVVHNSIPSRMTIGQIVETSVSQRCQHDGAVTDGTAFRKISVDDIGASLEAVGLRYNGLSRLYNGSTGEHYDAAIFIGPTAHQRLQKFARNDEYAVGMNGPTDALTGQPLEGKNARGGLRIGEMEAWVLEGHGAMATLTEKMLTDSDSRKTFICRTCGQQAIYNAHQGIYRCSRCGEGADICGVDSCKTSSVFVQEMRSANVSVEQQLRPREFEVQE